MKIAVINNCVPFISGGAEHLAGALTKKLLEYGHQAVLIKIPFRWQPAEKIIEHMLACQSMHLPNVDRAIALKFPAYFIPHPNKVLWLLHQFRQAYDLWGTSYQDIPNTPEGLRIRGVITTSDNTFLRQIRKIYTNSPVVSDRLKKFNGIESDVLYPPLLQSTYFKCVGYEDYIFYPSRITRGKRQHLLVESMKYVRSQVRLIIAGLPETDEDLANIKSIIDENDLQERVTVFPHFISEPDKANLFSRALGCAYVPYDEDSYGYVTLEAYHSKKPVITCSDSGGTAIVVKDQLTGYVVNPDPQAIADVMDDLYNDKARARRLGESGFESIQALGISWERVIEKLTA